jgi:hypothetical protein
MRRGLRVARKMTAARVDDDELVERRVFGPGTAA